MNRQLKKEEVNKKIANRILSQLKAHYPHAHCELEFKNPFELLIATILSAQCTDKRVNQVTRVLFQKYPHVKDLAEANLNDVEMIIRSTGFFKNKAKNIILASQVIQKNHKGEVPSTMLELQKLAGVGRKTANVVLGNAFDIASGIVVDTHVSRLSARLGFSSAKSPEQIEKDLMQLFKKNDWIMLSHYLIFHGRNLCKARSPNCEQCFLQDLCPSKVNF